VSKIYFRGMEIPDHTQESLENYLIKGWMPGGFLESILTCDYERALYTADTANRQQFWAIAMFVREHAPDGSWGSSEAVKLWSIDKDGRRAVYARKVEKDFIWNSLKENQYE